MWIARGGFDIQLLLLKILQVIYQICFLSSIFSVVKAWWACATVKYSFIGCMVYFGKTKLSAVALRTGTAKMECGEIRHA